MTGSANGRKRDSLARAAREGILECTDAHDPPRAEGGAEENVFDRAAKSTCIGVCTYRYTGWVGKLVSQTKGKIRQFIC